MVRFSALYILLVLIFATCNKRQSTNEIPTGTWRATITMQGKELPFNFDLICRKNGGYLAYLINGDEYLLLDEITVAGDSVDISLHIFDANIKAVYENNTLVGSFIKNYEKDYRLPFKAEFGKEYRFKKGTDSDPTDFSGKYDVTFYNDHDTTKAIGIFTQVKDSVTGTFLTTTGDYRFLQGNVANDTLQLSTFDGNHAYLFNAVRNDNGTLTGNYYSGKSHHQQWTGIKNDNAQLPDPESLTYLKPGYTSIEFQFPDLEGKSVSLDDAKFKNKVVVLQLFGTWCPNCMDETQFLAEWYKKNRNRGVEIIGLAYERKDDFDYASARVRKMVEKLNVDYTFLIAGTNDKEKAAATLPMLNQVVAFPTTIFIGRDGKVSKIHTGFSGPGTGIYYEQFVQEFNETVNELLSENFTSYNNSKIP